MLSLNAWAIGGDLVTARRMAMGCGTFYSTICIGGNSSQYGTVPIASCEAYNGYTSTWTTCADMLVARYAGVAVGNVGAAKVIGGLGGGVLDNKVYVGGSDGWYEDLFPLYYGRYWHGATCLPENTAYGGAVNYDYQWMERNDGRWWDSVYSAWRDTWRPFNYPNYTYPLTMFTNFEMAKWGMVSAVDTTGEGNSLSIGGYSGPSATASTIVKAYLGSAIWAEMSDINVARAVAFGGGNAISAIISSGYTPTGYAVTTEELDTQYDEKGVWSLTSDTIRSRQYGMGSGNAVEGIVFGGVSSVNNLDFNMVSTEEYIPPTTHAVWVMD